VNLKYSIGVMTASRVNVSPALNCFVVVAALSFGLGDLLCYEPFSVLEFSEGISLIPIAMDFSVQYSYTEHGSVYAFL
jgi:hypothetical protein